MYTAMYVNDALKAAYVDFVLSKALFLRSMHLTVSRSSLALPQNNLLEQTVPEPFRLKLSLFPSSP